MMRKIFLPLTLIVASCSLTPTIPDGEYIEQKHGTFVGGKVLYRVCEDEKKTKQRRLSTLERLTKICAPNAPSIIREEVTSTETKKIQKELFGEQVNLITFKCIIPH